MTTETDLLYEGRELFATGHTKESIDAFSEAADNDCNPVIVYLDRGAAYLTVSEFEKAIVDFNRVLRIDEDNERAFYFRGIAHMGAGAYEHAISDLTRSIELNHNRGASFLARSMAHAELDHNEEALRDVKTAVTLSNIEVESFANLFGNNRTMFDKFSALLEGERGPLRLVLNGDELAKAEKWLQ